MKLATQEDLDKFSINTIEDETIYPYLSTSKWIGKITLPESDWSGVYLIDKACTSLLRVTIERNRDIEFSICLHSQSSYLAGKAILEINRLIRMYRPRVLSSCVHSSNERSLKLNRKLLGQEWGIEKDVAWNFKTGEYEDLHWFRKVL